jgi:1-pyrroline-5-carboxylate dehydrogenase
VQVSKTYPKIHAFNNQSTWGDAVREGREEEFHRQYDNAVRRVRNQFGKSYPNIIGGEARYSSATFEDVYPGNRELVLGRFQKGSREDAKEAIQCADETFASWSETDWQQRVAIFRRASDIVNNSKFDFAALVTFDNGKNRYEALGDIDESIDLLRYYCYQMEINDGYILQMNRESSNEYVRSILEPYGVWAVIAPFNFVALSVGMSTGAMITGNTIVYKPASDTPWMGYRFLELLHEAGLPAGVMNYVAGEGGTVGDELVKNETLQGIVFTGSRDIGIASYSKFSSKIPRPFIAEMGGKNASFVSDNSDLEKAANGIANAAFIYAGQKCSATSRVYVIKSVKDKFLELLVKKTKSMEVGDPTLRNVSVTPLINESAFKKYQEAVKLAREEGAIVYGGEALGSYQTGNEIEFGNFVEPTIVTGLPRNHRLVLEELFVPIVVVMDVDSLGTTIQEINKSEYGLTAAIFSNDRSEIQYFFQHVKTGVIYANRESSATTGAQIGFQPFVGWKQSGTSGKGAGGPYYLQQFLREKTLTTVE